MAAYSDQVTRVQGKLEFDWPKTATWTDESQYLLGASWKQSMLLPSQLLGGNVEQPPSTAQFTLHNDTSRFNPLYAAGALYAYIQTAKFYGVPMRFSVGLHNGATFDYTRVFTGFVKSIQVLEGAETATITCEDNTLPFIQHRASDNVEVNQTTSQYLNVLKLLANVGSIDFDAGLNVIPYCWIDEERLWAEMNEVAHSEGGRVAFDRNGVLCFRNFESWVVDTVHTTSQHTFTTSRIQDVALPFNWKSTYNEVEVPYSPRREIGTIQVYKLAEAFTLLPGEQRIFTARYNKAVVSTSAPVVNVDYVIIGAGGVDLSGSITLVTTHHGQRSIIDITNNHATAAVDVVRFNLYGNALDGAQSSGSSQAAADADIGATTTKMYRLSPNAYIQSKAQADFLSSLLIGNLKVGRQMFRVSGAKAMPLLEPGYRVTVPTLDAGTFEGFIINIDSSFEGGDYRASYDVVDAANWLPSTGYHVITNAFSANKKAFF